MALHYLIVGEGAATLDLSGPGCHLVADGGAVVMEPWPPGRAALFELADAAALANARTKLAAAPGVVAFAIEAVATPGAGQAYVLAAHRIRDPERFRAYSDRVGAVVERFNGRFLARGGNLVALVGDFAPDRGVVLEFPRAQDAVDFYVSEVYAPLLALRLDTVDPGFVIVARSGELPADARHTAEAYLRERASR